jgi:hypothetical protein
MRTAESRATETPHGFKQYRVFLWVWKLC